MCRRNCLVAVQDERPLWQLSGSERRFAQRPAITHCGTASWARIRREIKIPGKSLQRLQWAAGRNDEQGRDHKRSDRCAERIAPGEDRWILLRYSHKAVAVLSNPKGCQDPSVALKGSGPSAIRRDLALRDMLPVSSEGRGARRSLHSIQHRRSSHRSRRGKWRLSS